MTLSQAGTLHKRPQLFVRVLILPITWYRRFLSPLTPPTCRFVPTCSAYAQQALLRHGVIRGGLLAGTRICRCHPWGGHGYDPVPGDGGMETDQS